MAITALKILRITLFIWIILVWSVHAEEFDHYQNMDRYDTFFQKYSKRYFDPDFDWRYFKAQAIAESRLRKKARSHDGAIGLMQLLPATFREVRRKNPTIESDPWLPRWNIAAALYYDRMLWETWYRKRSFKDRLSFMFGSYNAGKQAVMEAQQEALRQGIDPYRWASITQTLPKILGAGSHETIDYVKDIFTIREELPPADGNYP